MTLFLCTDMNNFKSSSVDPRMFESLKALIRDHKYNFLCEDSCQRFSTMVQQDEHNFVFLESLENLAFEATSIPLSLFTHLLHSPFPTCTSFEGTLEIIQQFEIVGVQIFVLAVLTDFQEFSLKCRRCRRNICPPSTIQDTLIFAPYCMLVHSGLPEKREVQTEGYCHPMLYSMGKPTYRNKGKVKH